MSTEDNKAVVRRVIDAWNHGDLSVLDDLFEPGPPADTRDRHTHSARELKQTMRVYRAAFPDLWMTVDEMLADEERVVVRFSAHGTHSGTLQGIAAAEAIAGVPIGERDYRRLMLIPPTEREVTFDGVALFTVRLGKIASLWMLLDEIDLMRQAGALPVAGSIRV